MIKSKPKCLQLMTLATVLAAGCGDGGSEGANGGSQGLGNVAEAGAMVEGIYQLRALTRNDHGCDAEGASALSELSDRFFVLTDNDTAGYSLIELTSCSDEAACRSTAEAMASGQSVAIEFSNSFSSVDDGALQGETAWTGFSDDGMCVDAELESSSLRTLSDDVIEIRVVHTAADPYSPEDGFCTTSAARKGAQGKPCSALEVYRAKRIGEL